MLDHDTDFSQSVQDFVASISDPSLELDPRVKIALESRLIDGDPAVSLFNLGFMIGSKTETIEIGMIRQHKEDLERILSGKIGQSLSPNDSTTIVNDSAEYNKPHATLRISLDCSSVTNDKDEAPETGQKSARELLALSLTKSRQIDKKTSDKEATSLGKCYLAFFFFLENGIIYPSGSAIGFNESTQDLGVNVEIGTKRIVDKARSGVVDRGLINNFVKIDDVGKKIGKYLPSKEGPAPMIGI